MAQADSPPRFSVHSARRNGVARVALRGELDLETVPLLAEHLALLDGNANGDGGRPTRLLLDLRGLTFMDSTGLRSVLDAAHDAARRGHGFAAVGVNPAVRKVFELAGTAEFLNEGGGLELIRRFTKAGADGDGR
ncbi:MAG TPA: STAS domain-containing protein [Actinomycetota bacterium]|jgi:anti-anti-sigma factor